MCAIHGHASVVTLYMFCMQSNALHGPAYEIQTHLEKGICNWVC